jgi:hypothetical protein
MRARILLVLLTLALGAVGWLVPTPRDALVTVAGVGLLGACAITQIALAIRAEQDEAKRRYVGRLRR